KINIENGFPASSIFLQNRNIFDEADFISPNVTDRPYENQVVEEPIIPLDEANINASSSEPSGEIAIFAGTSTSEPQLFSPEFVRPLPEAEPRKKKTCRRQSSKSRVLRDTPEKVRQVKRREKI
ncbi:hypothetical protein HHI36_016705, partial [Cryptolaemus montrouzieri]